MDLNLPQQLVSQALQTGRIGTPVAVRLVAHVAAPPHDALQQWAQQAADGWLSAQPSCRHELAASSADHTTALVSYLGGQSAMLCTGTARPDQQLLQITVAGSRGLLSWSDPPVTAAAEAPEPLAAPVRSPQPPPYGVLLVAGHDTHQPMYAAAFQADPRCRLIGLTDEQQLRPHRRQRNEQLAAELGIPLLPDYDQALARDDVHIVSICAEPIRRGPLIERAARAGKHLYLDKPLAGSDEEVGRIVQAVQQSGVLAHMFSSLTTMPAARVRQVLKSGRLGRLLAVHCEVYFAKGEAGTARLDQPRREHYPPERYEVVDAKRELTNVGVYPLTLLAAVLGQPPRRVTATTGNYFFAEHQARDMEDFGQIAMEFPDGVVATCSAGRTGWQSHPAEGLNRVCLIGSRGVAVVDAHLPRVEMWSAAEPWQPPERNPADPMGMWVAPPDSPYRAQPKLSWLAPPTLSPAADAAYFLECLENGRDSQAGILPAAAASRILLAAYRSAAGGGNVVLTGDA